MEASATDTLAELVDALAQLDASANQLAAARTQLIDMIRMLSGIVEAQSGQSTASSRDLAFRSIRAEVACALRVPERTVENLFGVSRMLIRELPQTMAALVAGEISYRHSQVIVDHAAGLEDDRLSTFDHLVVPVAASSTVSGLNLKARRLRESIDPGGLAERTKQADEQREVTWTPGQSGRGLLCIDLPVADGAAAYTRITDVALKLRAAERGSENPRTLAQIRADVARDALMSDSFAQLGGTLVRPDIFVTVPVFSLMGLTEEPAQLDGYGPIPADVARRLAANAPSFVRLLVHPFTGVVLGQDRDRYSSPADLRNAARVRYEVCGFTGCNQPAERCDLDHTVAWEHGGKTELKNLAPLCRGHHTMKHHTPWKVKQDPDGSGTLTWTSPAGRTYLNHPENRAHPPEIPPF